jgi:hypothetical protein
MKLHRRGMPLRGLLSAVLLAICITGCSAPIEHNKELAVKRAVEFAELVFVKRDFDKGYEQMSGKAKAYIPLDIFKDAMSRLHPDGYPRTVRANGYREEAEQNKVYVVVKGKNGGREFDYLLTLLGTAQTDYKVTIVNRSGFASSMGLE